MLGPESLVIQQFVEQFPLHELYRLFYRFFVSGKRFYGGWLSGEKTEPGFLISCTFALLYELEHINEPLSDLVLDRIHHHVISNVLNTNYSKTDFAQGKTSYREEGEYVGFGLIPGQNLSVKGYRELLKEQETLSFGYHVTIREGKTKHFRLVCKSDQSRKDSTIILNNYQKELGTASLAIDKIRVIVRMVKTLERLHPYNDGNCRSLGLIVLNRELIKIGQPLTILDDPNQLDGFSEDELVDKVIEGQRRFSELQLMGSFKTPFRSAIIINNRTNTRIPHEKLFTHDLTGLDNFTIDDAFEYDEFSNPYQGEPQDLEESLILRLIIETALKKAALVTPLAQRLLERLHNPIAEQKSTPFYVNDLNESVLNLVQAQSMYSLTLALKFGADLSEQIQFCCQQIPHFLHDHECMTDMGPLSLVGYCIFITRDQVAKRLCTLVPAAELVSLVEKDFYAASIYNDINKIIALASFLSETESKHEPRVKALLRHIDEYNRALEKPNQGFLVAWGLQKDNVLECKNRVLHEAGMLGSLQIQTSLQSKQKAM